jgi:hypothetical protein
MVPTRARAAGQCAHVVVTARAHPANAEPATIAEFTYAVFVRGRHISQAWRWPIHVIVVINCCVEHSCLCGGRVLTIGRRTYGSFVVEQARQAFTLLPVACNVSDGRIVCIIITSFNGASIGVDTPLTTATLTPHTE